jgi:hypothetical protein
MYDDWAALRDGYGKSLRELPSVVPAGLALLYLAPLLGRHRKQAYAAMVAGRAIAAARTGTPVVDALAHPLSVALAIGLWCRSSWSREVISWKGRAVPGGPRRARGAGGHQRPGMADGRTGTAPLGSRTEHESA